MTSDREMGNRAGSGAPEEQPRTVSDLIVEAMVFRGIEHVWGVVGPSNLGLADAIRCQAEHDRLSYYGVRHEGAAGIAASAYGRLTGRPAACLAGADIAAANLLAGLWDAVLGKSPVLALSAQIDSRALTCDAPQGTDPVDLLGKVACRTEIGRQDSRYAELVERAIKDSIRERGVSHLVVPAGLQAAAAQTETPADRATDRIIGRRIKRPGDAVGAAADEARRQPDSTVDAGCRQREGTARREAASGDELSAASLFAALERHIPDNAIITVDVGSNAYAFDLHFERANQIVLTPGYGGSVGFSFPAAMGAWAATQERERPFHGRKVVSISGDGGFARYMAELTTAVKHRMNITHLLLNNMGMSGTSQQQDAAGFDVWGTDLWNPHFGLWARNCGAMGVRITKLEELDLALERAMAHPAPSLVEVMVDPAQT